MKIRVITADIDVVYTCAKPTGTPKGPFARFMSEMGIDGCSVLMPGAEGRVMGVVASVAGNYFSGGGKKG
jgi:hypothetical protein